MKHTSFSDRRCPVARSLEEVGEWWSILILRDAFLGVRRFSDFQARLGITATTLTRRLTALVTSGMLEKVCYEEHPPRSEYRLTEKGRDFLPVVLSLLAWGNRWLATEGIALQLVDVASGAKVDPILVDRKTLRALTAGSVGLTLGPGADAALKAEFRRPRVLAERVKSNGGQAV